LAQFLTPELIALLFRKVGVLIQKNVPVPRDRPCEEFVVGHGDCWGHGGVMVVFSLVGVSDKMEELLSA
jgi:hypothetical protein